MKTKFQLTVLVLSLFVLSSTILFGEEESQIKSLDDAKTVADIQEFLKNLKTPKPEQKKSRQEVGEAYLKGGEKIIALSDNKQEQEEGVQLKIYGLKILDQVISVTAKNNETSKTINLEDYLNELEKEGKFTAVVNQERYNTFLLKIHFDLRGNFNLANFADLVQESKQWANKELIRSKPIQSFTAIIEAATSPQAKEFDPTLVDKIYNEILAFVRSDEFKATEKEKKETAKQLEIFYKRLQGELELYGKTLDDKVFDWGDLRGKYVLVNFTASWCGPCKREIPFILEAYEKYHDKGFEVISVYVWDKLEESKKSVEQEKLPWIILSEELTEKADLPKQGTAYGIQGVPTVLLIDKDGKIIASNIRGKKIDETLSKLFDEKNDQ
ncbi:MAG: TlpA family protein disulfide reductase [Planctomycetaceae bacterium]|jgi:thiol-disulfide isomerase/thioredoxin|nr:TlpA family protein disulfide reductase [Planctomycetaceae bacterium]